jgi:putative tricarboxylic transport membrane protein
MYHANTVTTRGFFCNMLLARRSARDAVSKSKIPAAGTDLRQRDQRRGEVCMADRVIFVCTLILAGIYFYATEKLPSLEIGDPLGPKAFPRLLGIALVITAVVLLLEILRARKQPVRPVANAQPVDARTYLVVAGVVVWTFAYILIFERLGFMIATSIFLLGLMSYFHRGKWVSNVLSAFGFAIGAYFLFKVLGVQLAPGILPL